MIRIHTEVDVEVDTINQFYFNTTHHYKVDSEVLTCQNKITNVKITLQHSV